MLFIEVVMMNRGSSTIDPTHRSAVFLLAALVLAGSLIGTGCSVAKRHSSERIGSGPGRLKVTLSTPTAARCNASTLAAAGDLRVRGFDEHALATISGAELSTGRPVQRELPPGLYSLSFAPKLEGQGATTPRWTLRDSKVLTVSSGRSTELLVHLDAVECER